MQLSHLIEHSQFMEATKCGIYNTLIKFRPDLHDAMKKVGGREINQTLYFLKQNELWDETADEYFKELTQRMSDYRQGPDEWSKQQRQKAQDRLMCYIAKVIRNSVGHGSK